MTQNDTQESAVQQSLRRGMQPIVTAVLVLSYIGIGVAGVYHFVGHPMAQQIQIWALTAGVVGLMARTLFNEVESSA